MELQQKGWPGFVSYDDADTPIAKMKAVLLRLLMWITFPPRLERISKTNTREKNKAIRMTEKWIKLVDTYKADLIDTEWCVDPATEEPSEDFWTRFE